MLPRYQFLIHRCCCTWSRNQGKLSIGIMSDCDPGRSEPGGKSGQESVIDLSERLDDDQVTSLPTGNNTCTHETDHIQIDEIKGTKDSSTLPHSTVKDSDAGKSPGVLSFDPSIVKVYVRTPPQASIGSSYTSDSISESSRLYSSFTHHVGMNNANPHINTSVPFQSLMMESSHNQGLSIFGHSGSVPVRHYHGTSVPTGSLGLGPIAPGSRPSLASKREGDVEQRYPAHFHSVVKRSRPDDEDKVKDFNDYLQDRFLREWEITPFGKHYAGNPRKNDFEFSLMTYNVLAQNLLMDNIYLYPGVQDYLLQWDYRKQRLVEEIRGHNPDIICLQEVHRDHYKDHFIPAFHSLGYESEYQQRTGDKLDGCAIFYKKDKFVLEKCHHVKYNKPPWKVLDRDNVGLVLKLKPRTKKDCDSVCIANTHLLYNPKRGDIKLAQLILLLAEVDRLSRSQSDASSRCPVILCGDFNSQPYSYLYNLLVNGHLRYEGLASSTLSGQKDGLASSTKKLLPKDFFPAKLNISDHCQYIDSHTYSTQVAQQTGEEKVSEMDNSPAIAAGQSQCHNNQVLATQNTGSLWHHLDLVSAYKHKICRMGHWERGVTSQHHRGSYILDYIFYSVHRQEIKTEHEKTRTLNNEGKLKLLGYLGLLSKQEIERKGQLPNEENPSDHIPLVAKFLLS